LPAEVIEQIVAKTDGVPLFVEELTKTVLESGLLRETADGYALTGPLPALAIPTTLQDSLMARLDRLVTAKGVAQLGATIGRQFAYDLLQAVAHLDSATLQRELGRLVAAELLYQRGMPPRATYTFKHALIQEAAYQSLLRGTRQRYHQQIAQVLAERFPETVESQPKLLAHHYTEAGLIPQAIPYWHCAGQRAVQGAAYVEAITHLTRGLELLATLPDTHERTQHELPLQATLGPALMATRGFAAPETEQTYARAWELCQHVEASPELFPILWGLCRFYTVRASLQRARELGERFLALTRPADDPTLCMVAHLALGIPLFLLGEFPASYVHVEQSMALSTLPAHHALAVHYGLDPGIQCLCYAALNLWVLGYQDQAFGRIHEAVTRARVISHPLSLTFAQTWAAVLQQQRGEWQAGQQWAEATCMLAVEQGFVQQLASATMIWGCILTRQGQVGEGIERMQQGLQAWRATGSEILVPYHLTLLAEAHGKAGDIAAGLQLLAEALAQMEATGERFYEAELYRLKGELLLAQEGTRQKLQEAETCFRQALDTARRQQAKSLDCGRR
jgi:predicted ATPase